MQIAFACPQCDATTQAEFDSDVRELDCAHCHYKVLTPEDAIVGEKLERCLVCGGRELFIRKDFSQRLGIAIIAIGFIAATVAWSQYWIVATFGILFATAAIDVVLYFTVKNLLECYRCHSQYRGLPGLESYEPFSLEVHEKYRQQAIRMKEAERT